MLTQLGGASEEVRAMSLSDGFLTEQDNRFGTWNEIKRFSDHEALLVVHNEISGVDAPYIFMLRGGRFNNVSKVHPEYYKSLLISQELNIDGSNLSPTLYNQLALLVRLSGDTKDAELLMDKYQKLKLAR